VFWLHSLHHCSARAPVALCFMITTSKALLARREKVCKGLA
jgi:hypothetical protein